MGHSSVGGLQKWALPISKTLKLIVPVGLVPPARVAVSETVPPAVAPVALVVTVGEAAITVLVSPVSLQRVLKPLLLASTSEVPASELHPPSISVSPLLL